MPIPCGHDPDMGDMYRCPDCGTYWYQTDKECPGCPRCEACNEIWHGEFVDINGEKVCRRCSERIMDGER